MNDDKDELLPSAIDVLRTTKRASASMLQRKLRIGYNRAARLLEELEEQGIVGPDNLSSPREILVDLDYIAESSSDEVLDEIKKKKQIDYEKILKQFLSNLRSATEHSEKYLDIPDITEIEELFSQIIQIPVSKLISEEKDLISLLLKVDGRSEYIKEKYNRQLLDLISHQNKIFDKLTGSASTGSNLLTRSYSNNTSKVTGAAAIMLAAQGRRIEENLDGISDQGSRIEENLGGISDQVSSDGYGFIG